MYCPTCGNEISIELKYCNRCGANLAVSSPNITTTMIAPVKLTAPTIVLGVTITAGLGIIISGATEFVRMGLHPAAITWIVLFSMATLLGSTSMLIRFWSKMFALQRDSQPKYPEFRPPLQRGLAQPQLPSRPEPVPSVTENTTRTFSHVYREGSERGNS